MSRRFADYVNLFVKILKLETSMSQNICIQLDMPGSFELIKNKLLLNDLKIPQKQTWGESTCNDSGRLFDTESDSSQFGYDSESDSSNISISDSDSDSNFQLLI